MERLKELFHRQQTHARHCSLRERHAGCKLSCQRDGGPTRDVRPMIPMCNEIPCQARWSSVDALARESHEHSSLVAHDGLHPSAEAIQWSRKTTHITQNPTLYEPGQTPDHQMAQVAPEPCLKSHGFHCGISQRKQLEIRNITAAEPSFTDRFRKLMSA